MRLLLDTHVALWSLFDDPRLSRTARDLILDPTNEICVSAATLWEIAIKHGLGRPGPNAMPISAAEAQAMFQATKRARVSLFFGNGRVFSDDEADMILDSPQGQHMAQMMKYSAVGTPDAVLAYLEEFTDHADADELIVAHQSTGTEARLRSVELLADAARLVRA